MLRRAGRVRVRVPSGVESSLVEQRFRGRLTEHAYQYTKGLLFDGVCPPGSRVRVEDVMTTLKTSRQPVMEAFKRLANEGFLEIIPQVGCRVVAPDAREISDFFRLFAAAEALTAEFAALRASEEDRRALRAVHAEIARLNPGSGAPEKLANAYRTLNRRFHGAIHTMSRSVIVGATAGGFWDRSDFYIATASSGELVFARRIADAHAEHEAILRAIEGGDTWAAHRKMEEHVLAFGRSCEGQRAEVLAARESG